MKPPNTAFSLLALLFAFFLHIGNAMADLSSDADTIFNWAEENFPQFFPPPGATTQSFDIWLYRYYPATDVYTGVNTDSEVWVLGDQFGGMVYINTVEELLTTISPAPPGNNFTGTWYITEEVDTTSCSEGPHTDYYTATSVVDANEVAFTSNERGTIRGVVDGNTATFTNVSFPSDGGGITTMTGTVEINGNIFSGGFNWSWTDGDFSCSGHTTISGERI